jgi:hypothetical protein
LRLLHGYWVGSNLGTMGDPPSVVSDGVLWSLFGAVAGSVAWVLAYKKAADPVVS